MMTTFRFVAINIILLFSIIAPARAQSLSTPAEVRKFTDSVMTFVGNGNYDAAWKKMKPATVLPAAEFDAFVAQFASQLPNISPRYGKTAGFEYIRDQQVGTALLRFQYISKFERSAMRWNFIFYRTDKGWVMTDFKFDGNVGLLFPGEG